DFGRPYVVGGLYNGRDVPNTGSVPLVDEASGTINVRRMETRRHHSVDLVDKFGSEGIFVRTGDSKLAVELDVAATRITVTSQGEVSISGAKGVTVASPAGEIALQGNKVSIQGNEVAVEARMALTLKAGMATVIQGRPVKIN
ncbi:MAG TPA: type IV secretion protein Rhs, partial [Actinomycetota bacterium]|nr:type IV secretion protein Rhs [Actinomycetota bacterium]